MLETLFEGMRGYEIILMMLGMFLFFALIFVLIYRTLRDQSVSRLYKLFLVPISMIGFSGNQARLAGNLIDETGERTHQVYFSPSDSAFEALETTISKVIKRRSLTPNTLLEIGEAYLALGDSSRALTFADSAFAADSLLRTVDVLEQLHSPNFRTFIARTRPLRVAT